LEATDVGHRSFVDKSGFDLPASNAQKVRKNCVIAKAADDAIWFYSGRFCGWRAVEKRACSRSLER
jgi:hypothetical protein